MTVVANTIPQMLSRRFADRPTAERVIRRWLGDWLRACFPEWAAQQTELPAAPDLVFLQPDPPGDYYRPVRLTDWVLDAVASGQSTTLEHRGLLSARLSLDGQTALALPDTPDWLGELLYGLQALTQGFAREMAQAQLDYWQVPDAQDMTPKAALVEALRLDLGQWLADPTLDKPARDVIAAVVAARADVTVLGWSVVVGFDQSSDYGVLPMLLLQGLGGALIECRPGCAPVVHRHQAAFAQALLGRLETRYRFTTLQWRLEPLRAPCIDSYACVCLSRLLADLASVCRAGHPQPEALQRALWAVTGPARLFGDDQRDAPAKANLPAWLQEAPAVERSAAAAALIGLAAAQARSGGAHYLDGVPGLLDFANHRLREQMLREHADAPGYPAELVLTFQIARGTPGTAWGTVERPQMNLAELALANLSGRPQGPLIDIRHRDGRPVPAWLDPDYVLALVQQVDIGQHYPTVLAKALLDDPLQRAWRQRLFDDALAGSLPLLAAQSRVEDAHGLDERGVGYVRGLIDTAQVDGQTIVLRPLALWRSADAVQCDTMLNGYLIGPEDMAAGPLLVYRPAYPQAPLIQFASPAHLLDALAEPGPLQDSLLTWLDEEARAVYSHGGLREPHLVGAIVDTQVWPQRPAPPRLDETLPHQGLFDLLYEGNARMLVCLADRHSTSNAESRWAIVRQGLGLLWQTALPLLTGPVAQVAWALQLAQSVVADVQALRQRSPFQRSQAVVDLLMNLALLVAHRPGLPALPATTAEPWSDPLRLAPGEVNGPLRQTAMAETLPAPALDFAWDTPLGRLDPATRKRLLELAVAMPMGRASAEGLLQLGEQRFALVEQHWYPVRQVPDGQGWQVVAGPAIRRQGGVWSFDFGLALRGGSPTGNDLGELAVDPARLVGATAGTGEYAGLRSLDGRWYAMVGQHTYCVTVEAAGVRIVAEDSSRTGPWLQRRGTGWAIERRGAVQSRVRNLIGALSGSEGARPYAAQFEAAYARLRDQVEQAGQVGERFARLAQRKSVLEGLIKRGDDPRWQQQLAEVEQDLHPLRDSIRRQSEALQPVLDQLMTLYRQIDAQFPATVRLLEATLQSILLNLYSKTASALVSACVQFKLSLAQIPFSARLAELDQQPSGTPEHVAAYGRYVQAMEEVDAGLQALSDRYEQLDEVLGKLQRLGREGRERSTLMRASLGKVHETMMLRVRHLHVLGELCIDRLAAMGAPEARFLSERISGRPLFEASVSHENVTRDLSLEADSRVAVLDSALRQYQRAEDAMGLGGDLGYLRQPLLARYRKVLGVLQEDAQHRLAAELREQATQQVVLPRPAPATGASGRARRVIRTRTQQVLVAEPRPPEADAPGLSIVDVRNPETDAVIASYVEHPDEGVWVELERAEPPTAPVAQPPMGAARARTQAREQLATRERRLADAKAQALRIQRPIELQDLLELQARACEDSARTLTGALLRPLDEADAALLEALRQAAAEYRAVGLGLRIEGYLQSTSPTGETLLFLKQQQAVSITRIDERKSLASGDYLEVHQIRDRDNQPLWEAHFHYPDLTTPRAQFSKGHLKTWAQRNLGRRDQIRQAREDRQVVAIYRADLTHRMAERIFVFA